MRFHFLHPSLDELAALGDAPDRERIAGHVRDCPKCQNSLRFLRRLEQASPSVLRADLPSRVLERSLASRADGRRVIAPAVSQGRSRDSHLVRAAVIAAGLAAIAALAVFSSRGEIVAGESESQLTFSPAAPQRGQRIEVRYRSAVLSFMHADRLVLRGRIRSPTGAMYRYTGMSLIDLATLSRDGEGLFRGSFLLPDSIVYAAVVVEDSLASTVDSRDGRPWTILVHDPAGNPTREALSQRQNDFMGRSWEEAYEAAKLNVRLHPLSVITWNDLEFFEKALLGDRAADSLAATRSATIDGLISRFRAAPEVPPGEISAIVWRSYVKHDSSAFKYWYDRLKSTAPHDPQVAQMATVRLADQLLKAAPRLLLDSLEALWPRVAPVYGPGGLIVSEGQQVAMLVGDGAAYLRWVDRASGGDSLFSTGTRLASFAPTRQEGMRRLRAALKQSATDLQNERPLTSNAEEYRRALADRRRQLMGALGEALIAAGKKREGLDTLSIAVEDGWDLQLLKKVASQRLALGDTVGALAIEAKIGADPRTPTAHVDSISRTAVQRLGQARWSEARANARLEMVREVMNRAITRKMIGDPSLVNAAGEVKQLSSLTARRPSVVIYWSSHCGPALEAFPAIDSVGRVLDEHGIATYLVVDESPSDETTKFFRDHKPGIPILYDSKRQVSAALRNFGTPAYYVLDEQGRIRFNQVDEVNDVLLQVAAIQSEAASLRGTSAQPR